MLPSINKSRHESRLLLFVHSIDSRLSLVSCFIEDKAESKRKACVGASHNNLYPER